MPEQQRKQNITFGALRNKKKNIQKELEYLKKEYRKTGILLTKSE